MIERSTKFFRIPLKTEQLKIGDSQNIHRGLFHETPQKPNEETVIGDLSLKNAAFIEGKDVYRIPKFDVQVTVIADDMLSVADNIPVTRDFSRSDHTIHLSEEQINSHVVTGRRWGVQRTYRWKANI